MRSIIRRGTFETNSSSSHSIVLFNKGYANVEVPDETICLSSKECNYGWGYKMLDTFEDKLGYYMASLLQYSTLEEHPEIDDLVEALKKINPKFEGIELYDEFSYGIGTEKQITEDFGHIAHQSMGVMSTAISSIQKRNKCNDIEAVVEYLTNDNIVVIIDNDNSPHWYYLKRHLVPEQDYVELDTVKEYWEL